MNFLETHELVITTLSPVHIGCGEDYEPTNYVIDGQQLYTFDPVLLMQKLTDDKRDEFDRIVRIPKGEESLRRIKSFFYHHRKTAMEIGRCCAMVNQSAQSFYDSRVGLVAQHEQGGKNVLSKLEIARSAYNPFSGLPILPGSSLKGAIRTALLEAFRTNEGKQYPIATRDKNERAIRQEASRLNKQLSEDMLGSFSTDPLRFLKISDASFRPKIKVKDKNGNIKEQIRIPAIRFQVNRKKHPNQFEASGNIHTLMECVPGYLTNAFAAQCVIETKTRQSNDIPAWQPDFSQIAKACNDFYLERFVAENEILKANRYALPWIENMEKRLAVDGVQGKAINTGQGFLLRVGRHSGAESVTVDAPRTIKIMKGKGRSAEWKQEATTLWLAAEDKDQMENMQPFGWIFVQRKVG